MRGTKHIILSLLCAAAAIGCHAQIAGTRQNDTTITSQQADTTKVTAGGQKARGYRIQVYSGGNTREDKNSAYRIGQELKDCFPEYPVYVHFYSPRWKCLMGNFTTYDDAQAVLETVRALGFSRATIVKSKIVAD